MPFKGVIWINFLLIFRWNWSVYSFINVMNFAFWIPDFRYDQILGLIFADHLCNVEGISLERNTVIFFSINCNFDWLPWKILVHLLLRFVQCSELFISSLQEFWTFTKCPFSSDLLLFFCVGALHSSFFCTLVFFSLLRFSLRCFLVLPHMSICVSINLTFFWELFIFICIISTIATYFNMQFNESNLGSFFLITVRINSTIMINLLEIEVKSD